MFAKVSGTVLGSAINEKTGKLDVTLFQQGERQLTIVSGLPVGTLVENGEVVSLDCNVFPWVSKKGVPNISCQYREVG